MDRRVVPEYHQEAAEQPNTHARDSAEAALSPLDELLSYWDGMHVPLRGLTVRSRSEALALFRLYQQSLGEMRHFRPDRRLSYARSYKPEKRAIISFVGAYLMLKRGERDGAARTLRDLTRQYPEFPDPWIWLSATTDDPVERIDALENAVLVEAAHPLAREALAIAQGRVLPRAKELRADGQQRVVQAKCPKCGGRLEYQPGATAVSCPYCGFLLELKETNVVNAEATLVGELQLRRRLQGYEWKEARRIMHCQACGAELTMSHLLAKECVFCGSNSVLVEDGQRIFEQPDGFLPFTLDESQAIGLVESAQRSTSGRLKTWWVGQKQELLGLHAVYLPFWVFDGFVEVRKRPLIHANGGIARDQTVWASALGGTRGRSSWGGLAANDERRAEKGSSVPRKDLIVFDNLVYSAVEFPPWWLLKQVLPFELRAVVSYEPRLLADWPAVLYQRDVEQVVQQAYSEMLVKAVWRNKSLAINQAAHLTELRRTFQVTAVTYQLVLLPMWVGLVRRDQEHKLVLVNGQAGNVVFSSPLRSERQ
jgi:predicted RNA-binding Zn-ribbon protein involved in translation (DUF1610 family)